MSLTGYASRREAVTAAIEDSGAHALLVTDLRNVHYLTGFRGSAGVVLIHADGQAVLCTDSRYEIQVAEQAPDVEHIISRHYVKDVLARRGDRDAAVLAVEADDLTLSRAAAVREELASAPGWVNDPIATTGVIENVRRIKDTAEIGLIARACEVADRAWQYLLDQQLIRAGRTERQVAADLEHAMRVAGSDGVSFPTIVASGPNGALPHYEPADRELRDGDLVVVDFGALVDGYASDCTRTVAIGEVSDTLRAIYDIVLTAQRTAVEAVHPGIGCAELDGVSRSIIDQAGYGSFFGHSLGHGVGLNVHEAPAVSSKATGTLFDGDVVTVEPGIYLPGEGGVRIEDTVAVHSSGYRVLTTTSKDFHTL